VIFISLGLLVMRVLAYLTDAFAGEIRRQTFGALCASPLGLEGVVRQKWRCAMVHIWPELIFILIGALISKDLFSDIYKQMTTNPGSFFGGLMFALSGVMVLWVHGIFFSLRVKRAPMGIALVVTWLGGLVFYGMLGEFFSREITMAISGTLLNGTYAYFVWRNCLKRLQAAMSDA
jgi:hypothetical protein